MSDLDDRYTFNENVIKKKLVGIRGAPVFPSRKTNFCFKLTGI